MNARSSAVKTQRESFSSSRSASRRVSQRSCNRRMPSWYAGSGFPGIGVDMSASLAEGRDRSALFPGEDPFLARGLAVADHRQGAVEAGSAHLAFPEQLAVLGALGLGFEGDRLAGPRRRVGAVAIAVAVARGRPEAAVLEA